MAVSSKTRFELEALGNGIPYLSPIFSAENGALIVEAVEQDNQELGAQPGSRINGL